MDLINTLILHIGLIIVFGTWYYFVCHGGRLRQLSHTPQCTNKDEGSLLHAMSSSLSALISKPMIPILIIAAGILSQLFVSGVLSLLHGIIPGAFTSYDKLVEEANSADTPLVLIVCICILAPIGEELLFRGVMLYYAKRFMPPILAVLLQAVLFGVYHGNVIQGSYAGFMGILLGAVVCRFKSIVPSMLLHLTVNVSLYFVPEVLYRTYNISIVTTAVSGFLLVGVLGILFDIFKKK